MINKGRYCFGNFEKEGFVKAFNHQLKITHFHGSIEVRKCVCSALLFENINFKYSIRYHSSTVFLIFSFFQMYRCFTKYFNDFDQSLEGLLNNF